MGARVRTTGASIEFEGKSLDLARASPRQRSESGSAFFQQRQPERFPARKVISFLSEIDCFF
jgi:hypothetical protein